MWTQTLRAPRARVFPALRAGLVTNTLKTGALLAGLTALVVVVAHAIGGPSAALIALVVTAGLQLASYWFSDRIVLAMHGAVDLPVDAAPRLHAILERLSARAGLPRPRLVYVPDGAPNAFATGRSPAHAVVAVTQGLLDLLDDDELEGVLAHELSHVANRDMLVMTIAATLAGAITLVARLAGWAMVFGGSRDEEHRGPGALESIVLIVLAPILAVIVQIAVSRSREYGADAKGALLCGDPQPLARALDKLHRSAEQVPSATASPATAHLYIVEPLFAVGGGLFRLFSTHPPVEERIRRLLGDR